MCWGAGDCQTPAPAVALTNTINQGLRTEPDPRLPGPLTSLDPNTITVPRVVSWSLGCGQLSVSRPIQCCRSERTPGDRETPRRGDRAAFQMHIGFQRGRKRLDRSVMEVLQEQPRKTERLHPSSSHCRCSTSKVWPGGHRLDVAWLQAAAGDCTPPPLEILTCGSRRWPE